MAHDITKYVEQMRAMEREVADLRRERETWKRQERSLEDKTSAGMPEIQVEINPCRNLIPKMVMSNTELWWMNKFGNILVVVMCRQGPKSASTAWMMKNFADI